MHKSWVLINGNKKFGSGGLVLIMAYERDAFNGVQWWMEGKDEERHLMVSFAPL